MSKINNNIVAEQNIINTIFDIRDSNKKEYTNEDILNELTNILDVIKNDKYFTTNFETVLQDKRLELGYCPICGHKLSTKNIKEFHSEIAEFGHTPYEDLSYTYCSHCGWEEN